MNLLFLVCQLLADEPCELVIMPAPEPVRFCEATAVLQVETWEQAHPGWYRFGRPWCEEADDA